MEPDDRRFGVAIFRAFLASLATAIAYITDAIGSTNESYSRQTPLLIAQLVVAVVGLLPAGLFARAVIRRKNSQAIVCLAIGLLIYLGWGVLNDADLHGSGNLETF